MLVAPELLVKRPSMPLSFSTLGCPDWTFEKIIDFAHLHNYHGLEIRGIQRELNLVKCPAFSTPASRKTTAGMMDDKGLKFISLGSSANLHFAAQPERQKNMDEARRFIELAHTIRCPYIRVFPNKFPEGTSKEATIDIITKGLYELAVFAKDSHVTVLMETHGDVVYSDDLQTIMKGVDHRNAGLIWDVTNMWTVTKEPPGEVYKKLRKYIRHVHVKDAKLLDKKVQYTFLGDGEVPIFAAIDLLRADHYKGFYSFEWEKLWHPELAEPEEALAHYATTMASRYGK